MSNLHEPVAAWIRARVTRNPPLAAEPELNTVLRVLAIWRSRAIANLLLRNHGAKILHGPFAGMDYVGTATEGPWPRVCWAPTNPNCTRPSPGSRPRTSTASSMWVARRAITPWAWPG
uniref:Uncharacterized protein n=1 Tax=Phenylobacterium glaciei TaxID=2803784 RepID=A0A974S8X8_9CAUL|nr:hypothetical protein JKL49_26100 [Phenylobacterium glaciei]